MENLLEVKNLRTSFFMHGNEVKAVNGVSYYIKQGEVVAIVGESGCGKSVTQMSVLQLIPSPPGKVLGGEVIYQGENLLQYSSKEMRKIRGAEISMIFQEPMTSLNPVFTVGQQMVDIIREHNNVSKREAKHMALKALEAVGIPDAEKRLNNYPFEMSGGMRQRVLIATSVACGSKLIIADEPTTALDVTTQAQVMDLLVSVVRDNDAALLLITHNLGLVSRYAERIYVMYAGKIVESGTSEQMLTDPRHPYTKGLLQSVPQLDMEQDERLIPIDGVPPDLSNLQEQCAFLPRCPYACEKCKGEKVPELQNMGENHFVACYLSDTEGARNE